MTTRMIGRTTEDEPSTRGGWLRVGGYSGFPVYYRFADNPKLPRNLTPGTPVWFALTHDDKGRPVAVGVRVEGGNGHA